MRSVHRENGPVWVYDGRNRLLALTIGLSPLWLIAWIHVTRSPFNGGMYLPSEAERLTALWFTAFVFVVAAALMVGGAIVIWRARSAGAVRAACALLTVPALILTVFAPAVVLFLRSLTA